MEIMVPCMEEFRFDSAASTPFVSAPSSPKSTCSDSFNYSSYPCYRSAPTSPTSACSTIPFAWEDTPGTSTRSPKSSNVRQYNDDFAFQFSGLAMSDNVTAADELFEKGRIRPLKPPPGHQSPKSPNRRVRHSKEMDFDPFTAAMVEATKERPGRAGMLPSNGSKKGSRSLSPMRGEVNSKDGVFQKSGRKWRLRDLFLFRSASEGRVIGNRNKDPVGKYTRKVQDSSFRSTDSSGSRSSRGMGSVHEMHYRGDRVAMEETKKKTKTALPFHRNGLFGCLRFNPAVASIARRFS